MALSNAEKQKRWREKRNELAVALTCKRDEVADNILRNLGAGQARKVSRALDKRLRDLKSDCPDCGGSGFFQLMFGPTVRSSLRCDCGNPEFLPKQERLTAAFCGWPTRRTTMPTHVEAWQEAIDGIANLPRNTRLELIVAAGNPWADQTRQGRNGGDRFWREILSPTPNTTLGAVIAAGVAAGFGENGVIRHLAWLFTWTDRGRFLKISGKFAIN
jgi:hypothetical protein